MAVCGFSLCGGVSGLKSAVARSLIPHSHLLPDTAHARDRPDQVGSPAGLYRRFAAASPKRLTLCPDARRRTTESGSAALAPHLSQAPPAHHNGRAHGRHAQAAAPPEQRETDLLRLSNYKGDDMGFKV